MGKRCKLMKERGRIADSGVSATEKESKVGNGSDSAVEASQSVEQWCVEMVVFQHQKKVNSAQQWCFSIVKVNSAEQWCFSIVKACLFEVGSSSPSGCASIGILQKSTVAWYFLTGIISK
jgi:hypothetical protein